MRKRILIFIAIIAIAVCSACALVACDDLNMQGTSGHIVILDSKCDLPIQIKNIENGAKITAPTEPTKEGYDFVSWKNAENNSTWNFEEDTVTTDLVLYVEWREIEKEPESPTYLVIFDSRGNEPISFAHVEEGAKVAEPSESTKDGYTFLCWKNSADNEEWNFEEDTVTADTVLYAEWQEIEKVPTYLVVFDSKGNEPISFAYVEEGAKVVEPSEPTRDGYTFLCWKNATDNMEWNFEEDTVSANTVLYAEWQEADKEPVNHLVIIDGKNGEPAKYLIVQDGEKIDVPAGVERDGFELVAWKNLANNEVWDFDKDVVTEVAVLYAEWIAKYLVTFDNGDGTTYTQFYVSEMEKIVRPINPTCKGKTFLYWQNCATGGVWDFDTEVTSDVELCAVWKTDFVKPCNGTVLTGYDNNLVMNPSMGQYETHLAIDFVSSDDLNVYAVNDGVIKQVGHNNLDGYYIVIEHEDGYVSKYMSLEETTLEVGTQVEQGQIIGTMSDTQGTESLKGVHLHFVLLKDSSAIDPSELIDLDEEE